MKNARCQAQCKIPSNIQWLISIVLVLVSHTTLAASLPRSTVVRSSLAMAMPTSTTPTSSPTSYLKKRILFIGTGGTIAGIAPDPKSPSYDPGKVTIDAILAAVPDIQQQADISGEQLLDQLRFEALLASGKSQAEALKDPSAFVNGASGDMNSYRWCLLRERIERALESENYDAVIVTHGTDTIEETAFFLEMTVRSNKPVILVGAARPSNSPQPDGPDNIREAVQVAIHPQTPGRGVLVVMQHLIFSGFNVSEARARQTVEPLINRFLSPRTGPLGQVWSSFVLWNDWSSQKQANIRDLKFDTNFRKPLPKVPILWQYAGSNSSELVAFYKAQGVKVFSVGGFGMGAAPADLRALISATLDPASELVFALSSRTKDAIADNAISYSPTDSMKGAVMSGPLNPYQSRIFLQLLLPAIESHQPSIESVLSQLPASASLRDKIRAVYTEFLYRRLGHLNPST